MTTTIKPPKGYRIVKRGNEKRGDMFWSHLFKHWEEIEFPHLNVFIKNKTPVARKITRKKA